MKIIYNPQDGAPISNFIFNNVLVDTHYPDRYEMPNGKLANGLVQYDDFTGEEILETYQFLKELSAEQAKEILERPEDPRYKCGFKDCDFATDTAVALSGHKKKHAKEIEAAKDPVVDPSLIPVAGGKRVMTIAEKQKMMNNGDVDIPNGSDRDGVEWYGEGVEVENRSAQSFAGTRKPGRAHFLG